MLPTTSAGSRNRLRQERESELRIDEILHEFSDSHSAVAEEEVRSPELEALLEEAMADEGPHYAAETAQVEGLAAAEGVAPLHAADDRSDGTGTDANSESEHDIAAAAAAAAAAAPAALRAPVRREESFSWRGYRFTCRPAAPSGDAGIRLSALYMRRTQPQSAQGAPGLCPGANDNAAESGAVIEGSRTGCWRAPSIPTKTPTMGSPCCLCFVDRQRAGRQSRASELWRERERETLASIA